MMDFVILKHSADHVHYDIMLERGNALFTLKVNEDDIFRLGEKGHVFAARIEDHRKRYLNYEGPISCGRGMVKIYDRGAFNIIRWGHDLIEIELYGKKISGKLRIKKTGSGDYKLNLL